MSVADDGATAWEPECGDETDGCGYCGGSGGGPDEALRCPYCTGLRRWRTRPWRDDIDD